MVKKNIRPLGTNEKIFWVLDQKTPSHFAVAAELEGNTSKEAWRLAIDEAQKRHPNLSVKITGHHYSNLTFEHVNNRPIPLKVLYSMEDYDWDNVIEEELALPFNMEEAPLARVVIIQQPGKSIFVFVTHHSIGDGMSVSLIIRDILSVLSGETLSDLALIPSMDQLAGIPSPEMQEDLTVAAELGKGEAWPALKVNRLRLSDVVTAKLIARTKSEGTSVHAALSAALILAGRKLAPEWGNKEVRILHPVSARKMLNVGDDYSLVLNSIVASYGTENDASFWDLARAAKESLSLTTTKEWLMAHLTGASALFTSNMDTDDVEKLIHQATDHDIVLTNLGLLPFKTDFGQFKILSIWGPMILTPQVNGQTIGVASINGNITLTLTSASPIKGLLKATEKIIIAACN